jgi:hypothetical protein
MGFRYLDDGRLSHRVLSLHHCEKYFGAYASFATLPLRTALLTDPDTLPFHPVFNGIDHDPLHRARNVEYVEALDFEDSEFFTLDEYRILLKVCDVITPRSGAKLCCDRGELERQAECPTEICESHAEALLKAFEFWVLRYDDKYEEWYEKYLREWANRQRGYYWRMDRESRDIDENEGFFEE